MAIGLEVRRAWQCQCDLKLIKFTGMKFNLSDPERNSQWRYLLTESEENFLPQKRRMLKSLNSEAIYELYSSPAVSGTIKSGRSILAAYEMPHKATYYLFSSPNVVPVAFCLLYMPSAIIPTF